MRTRSRRMRRRGGGGGVCISVVFWFFCGAWGKVFSVELLDKAGGEIKASLFDQGCDKYFDILEVGKCYVLSKGSGKIANRQFNTCNHRYELTCDKDMMYKML